MSIVRKISLAFSISLFVFSVRGFSQATLPCDLRQVIIPQFSVDSSSTFDNDLVKLNIINNIKYSQNEIELRLYTLDDLNSRLILIFVKNGDSAIFKTIHVVYSRYNIPILGFKQIRNKDFSVFVREKDYSIKNTFCSDLDSLLSCRLFTIQDEKRSLKIFNQIAEPHLTLDDKGSYSFELKYGDKYRNFSYTINVSKFVNPADLTDIKKILNTFFNEKPKN